MEIEDTNDWLGCPTPLEICRQHARLIENEAQELATQLRKARADIFKLVGLHAATAKERDELRPRLKEAEAKLFAVELELLSAKNSLNTLRGGIERVEAGAWGSPGRAGYVALVNSGSAPDR